MATAIIQARRFLTPEMTDGLSFIFTLAVLLLLSGKKHNDPENDSERNAFGIIFYRFAGFKASIFGNQ
jgi:hypothetical protein